MTTLPAWWEDFRKKCPPRTVRQRTCVYLTDRSSGETVEIVSDDLAVKAEPVKENTRGDQ